MAMTHVSPITTVTMATINFEEPQAIANTVASTANGHDTSYAHVSHHYYRHGNTVHSTLKKKARQANEKFSGFQKGAYRDGVKREETSQGWDWKHT